MQTFLPYNNFAETAQCLDSKRLGKQRLEARQILEILLGISSPKLTKMYRNHPAVKMWKGYEGALADYGYVICQEWRIARRYKDEQIYFFMSIEIPTVYPDWLGNERFHNSHKSNLLRKDPIFYGKYGWNVPLDLDYYWPTDEKRMVL